MVNAVEGQSSHVPAEAFIDMRVTSRESCAIEIANELSCRFRRSPPAQKKKEKEKAKQNQPQIS